MEYEDIQNGEDLLDYAVELKEQINTTKKVAKDCGNVIKALTKDKDLNAYLKALPGTVTDPDSKVAKIIVQFAEMVKAFKDNGVEYLLNGLFEEARDIYNLDFLPNYDSPESSVAEAALDYARNNRIAKKYQKELSDLAEDAANYDLVPKAGWSKYFELYYQKQNGKDVSERISDLCADLILQKDDLDEISSSIESLR